jgi:hypothetical protein
MNKHGCFELVVAARMNYTSNTHKMQFFLTAGWSLILVIMAHCSKAIFSLEIQF